MKYLKFYEEVQLNLTELEKDRNGEQRGEVLIRKLSADEPKLNIGGSEKDIDSIEIDGKKVKPNIAANKIKTNGKYDGKKAKKIFTKEPGFVNYKDVLVSGNKKYKLNQVTKNKEFGSVGPGVLTRQYEAIQCLFIAFKLRFPGLVMDKTQVINFWERYLNKDKEVFKRIGIYLDDKFELTAEIIDSLSTNIDWLNTFLRIPEMLMEFKGMFPRNGRRKYYIFLESNRDVESPVYKIFKRYNILKKELGSSINFSKFCPGDVYIVVSEKLDEINKKIDNAQSMGELVDILDFYFDRNELIPISLKKFKEGDQIIINKEANKKLPDFKILNFTITDDPLKGIGSKIKTKSFWTSESNPGEIPDSVERDVVFDSSDTGNARNIDGDVSGTSSRQGKITLKSILAIFENRTGQNLIDEYGLDIDTYSVLRGKTIKNLRDEIILVNDDIKSLVPLLVNELSTKTSKGISSKMYTDLSNDKEPNLLNRLISKLQSLQLLRALAIIQSESESDADKVITNIMRYALSIQTYEFDTPRYLRII